MTRPEFIRADTIDLQDRAAPSAKDHLRTNRPTSNGAHAPHQAETLREVAAESAEESLHSPRVSWITGDVGGLSDNGEELESHIAKSFSQLSSAKEEFTNGTMPTSQQQDALAIAQNGGISGHEVDDGDLDGETEDGMDDDMMDKISSSPSIEDEDIDFEFVYALHTFVATVEGQANATKGDTMVLLDDSNSYWWLVRVVKDSSIGYLPAEHIETPTERLARLNKHRNIDLSATMLGDQAEKSRNPLKSAIKRRKTKTVTFSSPTYVDYSDIEYSTEEEDIEAEYSSNQEQQGETQESNAEPDRSDESAKVEPLKPRTKPNDTARSEPKNQDGTDEAANVSQSDGRRSEEPVETKRADGPKKSSDGTVRDSFFKDDTVETKKITLTPNLLRDDNAPRTSSDSKDSKSRSSLDKLEKDSLLSKDDRKKKDKRDKDKKPNAIRNFFSRKGKKESDGAEEDYVGKRSVEVDSQDKEQLEEAEAQSSPEKTSGLQRQPSKLQKHQPRTEPSPTRKANGSQQKDPGADLSSLASEGRLNDVANVPPATMRIVNKDNPVATDVKSKKLMQGSSLQGGKTELSKSAWPHNTNGDPQVQIVDPPKLRMGIDSSVGYNDDVAEPGARESPDQKPKGGPSGAYLESIVSHQAVADEKHVPREGGKPKEQQDRLADSPIRSSPHNSSNTPPLMIDTSSQEEDEGHSSSRSTPSPELGARHRHAKQDSITTSTTTTTTSTWNDASLRAFFDSGSEIRDLLLVVYDKSDVAPVGPDHPIAGSLFKEQNAKLAEITTQLDNMLGDWLARKQRLRSTA
ncbi:hypothetical protein VTK73DRAFT_5894 [Phialemonium thermophilum]|uniref:SH3 domain-containing protein n=1 Tax=Phialemonium thermophilum TaxID=223376 RepID=A0ABR3XXZ2_9PEZI